MTNWLSAGNVATVLVILYALLGGALVVLSAVGAVESGELQLSFKEYLSQMVIAAGGLAIGRGLTARPTT